MNYPKFLTGDLVLPPRKRKPRMVWGMRRIADAYQYILLDDHDQVQECWEHELRAVSA